MKSFGTKSPGTKSPGMDAATVEYVARLSRVDLSPEERALFAEQLSGILDYIALLNALDTSNVAPLAQAVEVTNVLREDVVRESLTPAEAVANAPEKAGSFYKVPAILE
jgi:aspartyl-tRNA(Asn)/glutamyl-tRNA(Gln) amidotransferase subunit C